MSKIGFFAFIAVALPRCSDSLRTAHSSKYAQRDFAVFSPEPEKEDDVNISSGVRSVVVRLQNKTDQLDYYLENEAGQESVRAKAGQVQGKDPMAWFTSMFKKAGKTMKKAVMAVYQLMKEWIVDLCTWAAHGGLDDVVEMVKDGLATGFKSVKDFLKKVWSFFERIVEKTQIKEHLSSILKKAADVIRPIFGSKKSRSKNTDVSLNNPSSSSLLVLEQNQSSSAHLDAADASFLELVQKEALPKSVIKNSTVIEAIVPNKPLMFVLSVVIDIIGLSSYAADAAMMLGEVLDLAWAPLQALWLRDFFDGSWTIATIGFLEEIIPFTDALPTASLAWIFSYNNIIGCGLFRKILFLPDRSAIGYGACPQTTLADIAAKGYKVKKSKSKGHLYLKCKHGSRVESKRGKWQKASCVEKECNANGNWCFVKNHCGGMKGACTELDDQDTLACKPDPKKKH